MSEFIEPTIEEIETPIEENGMGNILDDLTYKVPFEIPQRVNPFCVISKATFGEYAVHDIQTNSAWSENPYSDYAVVPDDMVVSILETRGFCDITLNEDGTEIVEFTAREIPEIPTEEPGPTLEERVSNIEETLANGSGSTGTDVWDEIAVAIEEGVNEV